MEELEANSNITNCCMIQHRIQPQNSSLLTFNSKIQPGIKPAKMIRLWVSEINQSRSNAGDTGGKGFRELLKAFKIPH